MPLQEVKPWEMSMLREYERNSHNDYQRMTAQKFGVLTLAVGGAAIVISIATVVIGPYRSGIDGLGGRLKTLEVKFEALGQGQSELRKRITDETFLHGDRYSRFVAEHDDEATKKIADATRSYTDLLPKLESCTAKQKGEKGRTYESKQEHRASETDSAIEKLLGDIEALSKLLKAGGHASAPSGLDDGVAG